ncbi:hypothetical protein BJV77DRAFT_994913 [Russula vinacea]|nr:hypothetical protein BJV77DRAFT_994913 [Russula vinacea]
MGMDGLAGMVDFGAADAVLFVVTEILYCLIGWLGPFKGREWGAIMRSTEYGLGKSILYVTSAGPLFLFCYFQVFLFFL